MFPLHPKGWSFHKTVYMNYLEKQMRGIEKHLLDIRFLEKAIKDSENLIREKVTKKHQESTRTSVYQMGRAFPMVGATVRQPHLVSVVAVVRITEESHYFSGGSMSNQ